MSRGFRFDEAVADVYGDLRLVPVLRRLLRHTGRLTGSVAGSVSLIDADRGCYAHQRLAERGITVGRSYVNEYCTSLDMAGASLTLVRLDDEIESLLRAPAEAAVRVF